MSDSTKRMGLQFVGMAVGGMIGGPVGASIGGSVGAYAGQQLWPKDVPSGPQLDDLKVQSSAYGAPIPIYYGVWRAAGNVIWSSGIQEHKEEEDVGGKGGGPTRTTYSYTASLAVALGEGPIDDITKIWADSKLLLSQADLQSHPTADLVYLNRFEEGDTDYRRIKVYNGTETQEPDPLIESHEGAGEVPAHRGLVYVVLEDLELEDYGNRIPNITAEVVENGTIKRQHSGIPSTLSAYGISNNGFSVGSIGFGLIEIHGQPSNKQSDDEGDYIAYERGLLDHNGNFINRELTRIRFYDVNEPTNVGVRPATFYPGATTDVGAIWWRYEYPESEESPYLTSEAGALGPPHLFTDDGQFQDDHAGTLVTPAGVYTLVSEGVLEYRESPSPPRIIRTHAPDGGGGQAWLKTDKNNDSRAGFEGVAYDPIQEKILSLHTGDPDYTPSLEILEKDLTHIAKLDGSQMDGRFSVYDGQILNLRTSQDIRELKIDYINQTLTEIGKWYDGSNAVWEGGRIVHLDRNVVVTTSHGLIRDHLAPDPNYPLADAIARICERSGLSASDYDVSDITGTIQGFAHTRPTETKADLEPLLELFRIDMVESDGKLKFTERGEQPVATIPNADLGAAPGSEKPKEAVGTTRTQELELPRRFGVQYADPATDYEQGEQYAARVTTKAKSDQTIKAPVAIPGGQAASLAQKALISAWTARQQYQWATPMKWAHLDPGDVVAIEGDKATYTARITTADTLLHSVLTFQGIRDDPAAYQANATAAAGQGSGELEGAPGPTVYRLLDIPLLRGQDDGPGYYAAVSGYTDGWPGGIIERSRDGGNSWQTVASAVTKAPLGSALGTLGAPDHPWVWDNGHTVTVSVFTGSLNSASETDVLNGANRALLGDEIIAFRDATDNGDGTYTLSGLLRGLFGTEGAMSTHQPSDDFMLLATNSGVARVPQELSEQGVEGEYQAVTIGGRSASRNKKSFANTNEGLKPYAPAHLSAELQSDGSLYVTWVRRARYGGGWRDYVEVPLTEPYEEYDVELVDPSGSVIETQTVTSPSATLTNNPTYQTALAGYNVRAYQVSDTVGRGKLAEINL